ncbi:coniferyl-aldehyde dehydrogenase [Pseudomonas sp. NFACC15-1]|uniref:coniferyl aldehyde dehydrogenase n=1 Tax=unclassified Pseudomonas TaxID=196821 RepID=UPI00088E89CD|nr:MULTISPECIES: coniferyl aldehyde dehydrogenase [unclassified Pseudomonas]SDA92135.1 coniferyl-aldehyde dehydrogenase [Pseudomonas sp. NFACC15-1]SDY72362.1 coniferyl-aldehyde dehydrogenase [Pseudomonas sp. NFACC14]
MNISEHSAVTIGKMAQVLERMQKSQVADGLPSAQVRIERLNRLVEMVVKNSQALAEAISEDFGHRSKHQSLLGDIGVTVLAIKHNRDNLVSWMKPEHIADPFPGVKTAIEYQPLGVVGVISPWNFPIILSLSPVAAALAAGNRAMLKPSELTPRTSALLASLVREYFDESEFTVFCGDASVGAAFSALPFDHLMFTGSTAVAKHISKAAAENLVPVTLELGGKSPVVISKSADLTVAAKRIMAIKAFNAGQICLAPDYILVERSQVDELVEALVASTTDMYPSLLGNSDYTSMISQAAYTRQANLVNDALAKGATVVPINPALETFDGTRSKKYPPTLLLNVDGSMQVMQQEIFGPLLPIQVVENFTAAIDIINSKDRPLALYYFGTDDDEVTQVTQRTTSGAIVVNDVMTHAFSEDIPVGGVGASGIGQYHGIFGFRRFSHMKPVVRQSLGGESNIALRAPFGELQNQIIEAMLVDDTPGSKCS